MKYDALAALLIWLAPSAVAYERRAKDPLVYTTVIDDFKKGFSVNSPNAKWNYFSFGPYIGSDGVASTSNPKGGRLTVTSPGTGPGGEPAFTLTAPPAGGLPGDIDHVKWLVFANATSSAGYPGFDTAAGYVTSCEAQVGGRLFGTESNPFGASATDPSLGFVGGVNGDFETFMIFDFALTNDGVYVLYERLPFGRTESHNYASFTALKRVASRSPGDMHDLKVSYDRSAKTVSWLVGGRQVYRIDRVGYYPSDRAEVVIDRGGIEEDVGEMRQLVCGFGTFTLMDGFVPSLGKGMVRLNPANGYYVHPTTRSPLEFVDDISAEENRIFGQGSELVVGSVTISSARSGRKGKRVGPLRSSPLDK
ncbi:hypothetical protein CC85DRAFT_284169 [Cutaneotrichosporon oleaginosum]|uniref:Concanavalin A-like lectin/glucanase n=1 Tax=Cutaneotrichosporon oleaginosum TaxID=879819 RepID=A0A0J0XS43_9TREE|nr:uncharacterized protein CC85DRAFT_284169 [Cutaneotrichosporon oleaginosum]KLT43888.1 hypothetical protein CC85DRAFT_284169 [Cutaneotrichosporon oleaginosum]TXT06372.1 hypothetical protein COLE_05703 [Cutaneotrichosporon oleaginosum]